MSTTTPVPNPTTWRPVVGEEATELLAAVPPTSRNEVQNSAVTILSKGISPSTQVGQQTGLVVGYIQSGKTLSFEAVAALARDNRFPIVIIIAGIGNNLLEQSINRIKKDFKLEDLGRPRRWILFRNATNDGPTLQAVNDALNDWRDPRTPEFLRRTVILPVLKHHARLAGLSELMEGLSLTGVPVLIIDDEADQASLNTEVAQGQESTTYRRLMELRRQLPNHTYLQYTATPQAPLLINIIDSLSPNFVHVLEPGPDYTGGREFFAEGSGYVRVIPPGDVPTNANPLSDPPASLLEALRIFMVGVTAGLMQNRNTRNRSMLVHPSHRTTRHEEYYTWVMGIFDEWKRILDLPDHEQDKQELIEDLRTAYDDLATTVTDLPPFDNLIPMFKYGFSSTQVLEVNTRLGATPSVPWPNAYGWILVGGQSMDRGFTVEGLTVTYMPRGIGVGNADTIQQRARFFGYKRPYLNYCRVYLEQATFDAFQNYVEHEEYMRGQLEAIQTSGRSLDDWKRVFILETALRPCRHNVLQFDYMRGRFSADWVYPKIALAPENVVVANRAAINSFLQRHQLVDDSGHAQRTPIEKHKVCQVPLRDVMEEILVKFRITGNTDSQRFTGLMLQLSKALENNPNEVCSVYLMSPSERRKRGVNDDGEIANLFQGENPVVPLERRGEIYPGDRAIRQDNNVTIQIHMLDLTKNRTEVVAANVPVVSVWVPQRLETAWIIQNQNN